MSEIVPMVSFFRNMSVKVTITEPSGLETKFICPLNWFAELNGSKGCRFELVDDLPTLICKPSHRMKITIRPVGEGTTEGNCIHIFPSPHCEVSLSLEIPQKSNIFYVNQRESCDEID
jgi:hypothetical protein